MFSAVLGYFPLSDLAPPGPRRVLHVLPTFAVGGAQVRTAALLNHFRDEFHHSIISLDGCFDCAERLDPGITFEKIAFPRLPGESMPARLRRIRLVLRAASPDVLVTINWGSMDWAMANLLLRRLRHVHIEDGFGPDESEGQKIRRVCTRRMVLPWSLVMLPSRTLLRGARNIWRLPASGLHFIPNGIDLTRFAPNGPPAALDVAGSGPLIGTVAALRAVKNIARLLRSVAILRTEGVSLRLAVIGEGAERSALEAQAYELGIADVTRFLGHVPDPAAAYRAFDIFALSSDTEQMPFSVLEAMGSGLAVASTDVGDVRDMLAPEGDDFVVAKTDDALAAALRGLVRDPSRRAMIGAANRAKAERDYDQEVMFARHAALWRGVG